MTAADTRTEAEKTNRRDPLPPIPQMHRPGRTHRKLPTMRDPVVGTGAESFWHRRTNTYPGCTCPPWRYNPRHPKPTNPECELHGWKPKTTEIETSTTAS